MLEIKWYRNIVVETRFGSLLSGGSQVSITEYVIDANLLLRFFAFMCLCVKEKNRNFEKFCVVEEISVCFWSVFQAIIVCFSLSLLRSVID